MYRESEIKESLKCYILMWIGSDTMQECADIAEYSEETDILAEKMAEICVKMLKSELN